MLSILFVDVLWAYTYYVDIFIRKFLRSDNIALNARSERNV